jgi:SAM-dependent methyltransferase
MNINEFISTLPTSVVKGDSISLPDDVIRRMFKLARVSKKDIFYDLGCGNSNAVYIAATENKVKKAIGVEKRKKSVASLLEKTRSLRNAKVIINDIRNVDISEGSVFLFWFHDEKTVKQMMQKFSAELKGGSRIITIWAPPDLIIPNKIDFPFFVSRTPFRFAKSIEDQIKAIYGQKCLDFTASARSKRPTSLNCHVRTSSKTGWERSPGGWVSTTFTASARSRFRSLIPFCRLM